MKTPRLSRPSAPWTFATALAAISIAACSSGGPLDPADRLASSVTAAPDPCRDYPLRITPPPDAEAKARAAFARLSPGASVWFAPGRGTIQTVTALELSIGNCPFGRNADEIARKTLGSERDAFSIEPSEWTTTSPVPACNDIPAGGVMVYWQRSAIGGQPMNKDVFHYRLKRAGQRVTIDFAGGHYVPPACSALATTLAACPKLDPDAAEASVRKSVLPYETFQYCAMTGGGTYAPHEADVFALANDYWEWDEAPDAITLRRTRQGSLEVAPENYTPALLASNANCPRPGGAPYVGFGLRLDSVRSSLFESSPGLGCIVCVR